MNDNKSRTIIEQPQGESELVQVLVTLFALCAVIGMGLFYGGYWFGPVLFVPGLLGLLVLEIGGKRK
jgi:fatty acid desaturase